MLLLLEREALRIFQSGFFENHSLQISVKQAEEPPNQWDRLRRDQGLRYPAREHCMPGH